LATILNGKELAATLRAEQTEEIRKLAPLAGRPPGLGVILVGDDPASHAYVKNKRNACKEAGIHAPEINLPHDTTRETVMEWVDKLNADPKIDGILVQLPLPPHIPKDDILIRIDPEKDVDGFHPINVGRLVIGEDTLVPCTPTGVMTLLSRYGIPVKGKKAVVLGRSLIVGKPMALLLLAADATVTICHSKTANLSEETRQADILVAALGKPLMITKDFVKKGAVVIDVGISRNDKGKLVGDVDFDSVEPIASAITPVPGGVGPMTIATLLENTLKAYKKRNHLS